MTSKYKMWLLIVACLGFGQAEAQSQNILRITTPTDGQVIAPGQTFIIQAVLADGLPVDYFEGLVLAVGNRDLQISGLQGLGPYRFTARMPADAYGEYTIKVIGGRPNSVAVSSPIVKISAGTAFPALKSLRISQSKVSIKFPGEFGQDLLFTGEAQDGRFITIPLASVQISIADPTIVALIDNVPVGKRSGTTTITVSVGQLSKTIPVTVGAISKRGDFDGNGQIDSNDIAYLNQFLNTPAVSADDARDLNGDGKIDALDARILATLCTKPRCAI